MKRLVCIVVAMVLLPACRTPRRDLASPEERTSSTSGLGKVFADYYEERLKLYPLEATLAGDRRYDDWLPNTLTDSYRSEAGAFYRRHLTALGRFNRDELSEDDQISYDVLKWECEMSLKQLQFPTQLLPIAQFESLHLQIGQWAGGQSAQPFETVHDYENWLKRLDSFTAWSATAVVKMREGTKRGYVLPTALIQKVGMLSAEMHRAIRLVVDVGLHAKGWSREQAIQYSLEHEAKPESSIVAEIERYMAWPGQALSYKIGQLKIRELRARAEKQLGRRFDVREFHDRVLESGCVPLRVLEAKIDRWLQGKRSLADHRLKFPGIGLLRD